MKKSCFNIFVPFDKGTIIYNSFSGAIGTFDDSTMQKYEADSFSEKEYELLKQKGIYVEDDFDEYAVMYTDRENSCVNKKEKYIRLWTTSACNADCFYCFEKGLPAVHMNRKTADKVIKYITDTYDGEERIIFEWFGGEPLLNTEIIDYIYDSMKAFCADKSCKVQSEFITNGSLIDQAMIDRMVKWNTRQVQITLDGDEDEYNKAKAYKCDKYNFKSVMEAISELTKRIHTVIRINYNCTNYESISSLLDKLSLISTEKTSAYIYPLWDSLGEDDLYKSTAAADLNLIKLFEKMVKYGLANEKLVARLNYKKGTCKACNTRSVAIFPDGTIGKCSEAFTQKIGDVEEGIRNRKIFDTWTSPEIDDKCKSCSILPLCQGGCKASKFTSMPQCHPYKDIIPDILKWYVGRQMNPNK